MTITNAWRQVRLLLVSGDVLAVVATYIIADIIRTRFWLGKAWPEQVPGFGSAFIVHYWTLAIIPIIWPMVLARLDWYPAAAAPTRRKRLSEFIRAVWASLLLGMILAGLALFFRRDLFPRMQIVLFTAILPATTLAARSITGIVGRWLADRAHPRHVLIVGTGREAIRLRRLLRAAAFGRCEVVGHLAIRSQQSETGGTGAVLGDESQLARILEDEVIDEVFFAVGAAELEWTLPLVRACEEVGVTAHVFAESLVCHSKPEVEDFLGMAMLGYAPVRHSPELLVVKRLLDLVIATIGIVLAGPIMLICAILIRTSGQGPILFRQIRSGLNGRPFEMLKFRTMAVDAEARKNELEHLNESAGPVFKIRADPRITRVGAVMRRFSLDELPQLFNVLRGEMSIVGPRPPLPEEVIQYDRWQRRRLSMRPGLTCLWQINGRHRIPFEEWMRMDLYYIDHWSIGMDLRIICRTVATVLAGSGA